jgi:hypothetical protein
VNLRRSADGGSLEGDLTQKQGGFLKVVITER